MKIQAEAAASHNRVALDRMLIDQLPQIVEKAALGLSSANLTVLNGAEGLGQVAAGLVSQGIAIFEALRGGVIDYEDDYDDDTASAGRRELRLRIEPTALSLTAPKSVAPQHDSLGPCRRACHRRSNDRAAVHAHRRIEPPPNRVSTCTTE